MEMSQDAPPSRWTVAELLMVPSLSFGRQRGPQSPCLLHTAFHLQLHPVWSGRSLSLSTTAFGKGSRKERKPRQSEAELNSYGQDFQKSPTVLYIHLQSCISHKGSKFRHSSLMYMEGLFDKYKSVNAFYEVNYLNHVSLNILLIGCSAPSYTEEKLLYKVRALLFKAKVERVFTALIWRALMKTMFSFALLSAWKVQSEVREGSHASKGNVVSPSTTASLIFVEVPKRKRSKQRYLKTSAKQTAKEWFKRRSPG